MAILNEQGLNRLIDNISKNINKKINAIKDIVDAKVANKLKGSIYISKPIIQVESNKYIIEVTVDGLLTCKATATTEEASDLILKADNGTLYKVTVSSNMELMTEIVTDVESNDVYVQAQKGAIYKINVSNEGVLTTCPISNPNLIDDSVLSKDKAWSSLKVSETIDNIPVATISKNGLMSKEDKTKVDSISQLSATVNQINVDLTDANDNISQINTSLSAKLDKSSITISKSQPSGGKNGDIWIMYE